jgi:peptidoglycan/LPS O-acetylase OafA/YrhL
VTASRDAGDGFGILRIVAALMVLFSHSFPLSGAGEPAWRRGSVVISFGSAGVDIFFIISGYLVFASWLRDPNPGRFAVRRIARIWPGLVAVILVTTLVLGTLITEMPRAQFLTDPATYAYLFGNIFLLPIGKLPAVFQSNPNQFVNGSLWTLPIEITAYGGIIVVGHLLAANRWTTVARRLGGIVMGLVGAIVGFTAMGLPAAGFIDYWLEQPFFDFFFFGCLLYAFRDRVALRWPLFAAAVVALAATMLIGYMAPVYPLLAYCVIFVCSRRWAAFVRLTNLGDPSYGIYIYAYPVQQLLVFLGAGFNPWLLFVEASLVSIPIGYLSWHLLESRSLQLARTWLGRQRRPNATSLSAAA